MNRRSLLLGIILIVFALSIFRTVQQVSLGKTRLAEVKSEVNKTIDRKIALEKEIQERESLTYLEAEARNRLNLIKPGERMIILPNRPGEENPTDSNLVFGDSQSSNKSNDPNWLKWKRLFFD